MSEGELSKRAIRMEEIDDLVVKMLDVEEAKADFPLFYYDLEQMKKDIKNIVGFNLNKEGQIKIIEWFERWFGSAEASNNTHVDKEEGAKITPNKKVVKK